MIRTLLLTAMLAFATPAFSQAVCGPKPQVLEALKKYEEKLVNYGLVTSDGQQMFYVTVNEETGTWSILKDILMNDGTVVTCVMVVGNQFIQLETEKEGEGL